MSQRYSSALNRFLHIFELVFLLLTHIAVKAEKSMYIPEFNGTLRARYEYLTRQEIGAFKIRTLRLGLVGYVAPIMSYNAEVELSDWGKIYLVNGFVNVAPISNLNFTLGQQRIPFTISAHRAPCDQYFVNRTFIAKYGGFRDIGLSGSFTVPKIPLTAQAAVFNSSGLGDHKLYFTKSYGFSVKLISPFLPNWYASVSTARLKQGIAWVQMWDAGAYFQTPLWHIEAEYLRKNYNHGLFEGVNAFDFFIYRKFPIEKKMIDAISGALRYDFMGNHSSGLPDENGVLKADDPECHRLTVGATLSLQTKFQADIRVNYEKYFLNKGVTPSTSNDDRIVLEVIAHF